MALDDEPVLTAADTSGQGVLEARGAWTVAHAGRLAAVSVAGTPQDATSVDAGRITNLDTYGATVLARLSQSLGVGGAGVQIVGAETRFAPLLEAVRRASPVSEELSAPPTLREELQAWWRSAENALRRAFDEAFELLLLLGRVVVALIESVRHPQSFRFTATVHQLDRVAWQAVPIVGLITFLIGAIIAQQGFFHFRKFGADQYVVDMVGLLVVREIGVLLVAIMVAGRSGSSFTAEIGSMKMREEIDALRTMGLDPTAVLIVPRIVTLIVALPILTLLGSLAALLGGGFAAWIYGDMSPSIYIGRLQEALSMTHFKVGMIKAPFMALGIGLIACAEGLKVAGSAQSLGLKTTASVVKSIFLVIVLDGLFAMYFAAIGM